MIRSISSMSETMPCAFLLVAHADLDAEPQSRERRAQVVRNAGEQQRAILLRLLQIGQHVVEAAIEVDDLRRPGLGQRRRRLALADARDRVVELAQRPGQIAREGIGADQQYRERDQAPLQRARGRVVAPVAATESPPSTPGRRPAA